jgi:hypothetical protein
MNNGYYITLGQISSTTYDLTGSDTIPIFTRTSGVFTGAVGDLLGRSATVLRDEGKTLRSANRVFRKVQLMMSTGSVLDGVNGTDGVGGVAAPNTTNTGYLTAYIELPGNPSSGTSSVTPVARLG